MHLYLKNLVFSSEIGPKVLCSACPRDNEEFNSLYTRVTERPGHELFPKSYRKNECLAVMAVEEETALKLGFVQSFQSFQFPCRELLGGNQSKTGLARLWQESLGKKRWERQQFIRRGDWSLQTPTEA